MQLYFASLVLALVPQASSQWPSWIATKWCFSLLIFPLANRRTVQKLAWLMGKSTVLSGSERSKWGHYTGWSFAPFCCQESSKSLHPRLPLRFSLYRRLPPDFIAHVQSPSSHCPLHFSQDIPWPHWLLVNWTFSCLSRPSFLSFWPFCCWQDGASSWVEASSWGTWLAPWSAQARTARPDAANAWQSRVTIPC